MKKKMASISLVLMILVTLIPSSVQAQQDIKIIVNNQKIKTDVSPYIENNRTMVPVRFVTEALKGTVYFSGDDNGFEMDDYYGYPHVLVSSNDPTDLGLVLFINKPIAFVSEGTYRMDSPPVIKNGRTFVPLRFLADYLNFDTLWVEETQTIYITSKKTNEDTFTDKYWDDDAAWRLSDWLGTLTKNDFDAIFE